MRLIVAWTGEKIVEESDVPSDVEIVAIVSRETVEDATNVNAN